MDKLLLADEVYQSMLRKGSKSNTCPNFTYKKYVFNIDWLTLNVINNNILPDNLISGEIHQVNETFELVYAGGTQHFKNRAELFYNSNFCASIVWAPRNLKADKALVQITLANVYLYSNDLPDLLDSIEQILPIKNISRLDIAYDTNVDIREYVSVGLLQDSILAMKGKAKISPVSYDSNKLAYETLYVGKRSGNKSIAIYDKSKQLIQDDKKYILDAWEQAGLDKQNVDRIEYRFKNEAINQYDVDEPHYKIYQAVKHKDYSILNGFVKMHSKNFGEIIKNTNDKNKSRAQICNLIDWENIEYYQCEKKSEIPASEIWSVKITCKTLHLVWKTATNEDVRNNAYETLKYLLDKYILKEWYKEKNQYWLK